MAEIATTRAGRVEGQTERGATVFRGIPFARPPVNGLRFRAPEPPELWSGVRPARSFGPSSPQLPGLVPMVSRLIGSGTSGQSEDCLYLNVWTPALDGRRRPVLVWIHGGAFVMGSGSTPLYSGRRLARRGDCVVVTLNYRLGALGFLSLRDLIPGAGDAPSNLGIRDQIAALAWVRDNIDAFGGDPENVTLFGESAGAMSVATLLGTPSARGLFHRAVMQSGAAHNISTRDQAATVAEQLMKQLGIDALDTGALERLPVDEIVRAQRDVTLRLGIQLGTLPWQPSAGDDLLPEAPLAAIESGLSSQVPVLIGTNRDEWKLFMLGDRKGRRLDEEGLRSRLERTIPGSDSSGVPWAERAVEAYAGLRRGQATPSEKWIAIQTDRIFRYPAMRLAELHAAHTPATYAYLFTWTPPVGRDRVGAAHGIEIPFVFGTLREPLLRPVFTLAPGAMELSRRMLDAWVHFARDGAPGHDDLPSWPRYDSFGRATMRLGRNPRVEEAPLDEQRRFWAGFGGASAG
jgi:para-nitrobenzyl esterase